MVFIIYNSTRNKHLIFANNLTDIDLSEINFNYEIAVYYYHIFQMDIQMPSKILDSSNRIYTDIDVKSDKDIRLLNLKHFIKVSYEKNYDTCECDMDDCPYNKKKL